MKAELSATQQNQRWFVRPEPREEAELRLFCLPYAGGGAALYRPWLAHLPPSIELTMVQLPGREARLREAPYTRMDDLIEDLTPAVAASLDRPYMLFGHSMGALLAFELARALVCRGAPAPECLFVSGRRAPQLPDPDEPLHTLADAAFVRAIVRRYNGIPRAILEDVELLRLFLPTLRADFTLLEGYSYRPGPPLTCPIMAFGGRADERASCAELAAWGCQTPTPVEVTLLPGDHFYLQSARAELVAALVERTRDLVGRSS